jgi:hypothetical protein
MRSAAFVALAAALPLAAVTGCSGSSGGATNAGGTTQEARTAVSDSESTQAALTRGVRSALFANHRLSVRVLWSNQIPASARESTNGPALASLRAAAASRRARGIRVRMLEDDHRVLSVRLDPSYAQATAIVLDRQLVQPSRADGRPRGHAVRLVERARYELHRIGVSRRFVVWKVVLLK